MRIPQLAQTIVDPEERGAALEERFGVAASQARSMGCCTAQIQAAKTRRDDAAATFGRLERTILFNPDGSPREPTQGERAGALREMHVKLDAWEGAIGRLEAEIDATNGAPVEKSFFRFDNPVMWGAGVAVALTVAVAAGVGPFGGR